MLRRSHFTHLLRGTAAAGLAALLLPGIAAADGSWIDEPEIAQWNTPGMEIPAAPEFIDPGLPDNRCGADERWVETFEDGEVVAAGWHLMGSYVGGWGAYIVGGLAGYDGMCRPLNYQYFVFVDGQFAGTLSPSTMDSRADGSGFGPTIYGNQIDLQFSRYTEDDPLCCPSATSTVQYMIERYEEGPVVTAVSASTEQHQQPE